MKNNTDKRVRFNEQEFFLILPTGDIKDGGPLCTAEQFSKFELSSTHLFEDGKIYCFHEVIGTIDDLEIIEENVDIYDYV